MPKKLQILALGVFIILLIIFLFFWFFNENEEQIIIRQEPNNISNVGDGARSFGFSIEELANLTAQTKSIEIRASIPFQRVGLMWDAPTSRGKSAILVRALNNGIWTEWKKVIITFNAKETYNGGINFNKPATILQLRAKNGWPITYLNVELFND